MQSDPRPIDQDEPSTPDETQTRLALRQALIDLEAAKSRVERDAARVREETKQQLVSELLPVLDNLDRSIAAGSGDDPVVQGVKQVRVQLENVLRGYGVERFDAVGVRFDPREHDAVTMVEVRQRERDGVVVDQLEAGYRSGQRLLRPARVAVGRFQQAAPVAPAPAEPDPVDTYRARIEAARHQERARLEALRAEEARRQAARAWPGAAWDPWTRRR